MPAPPRPDRDEIARAAAALRAGELVAFPTETVYGLGADASSPAALARLYAVKDRPADHPAIVHVDDVEAIGAWAVDVPDAAVRLAVACWPGPLTLVLRRAPGVLDAVTGGQDTVALRVPRQRVALDLLRAFEGGVAAPSANRFGRVSPTTAEHVRADLGDDVAMVLDGGPCRVGVESTIVDCTHEPFRILRLGRIGPLEVQERSGVRVASTGGQRDEDAAVVRAPGGLASHYAPRARVVIVPEALALFPAMDEELAEGRRVGVIAADIPTFPRAYISRVLILGAPLGSMKYAQTLYGMLRTADVLQVDVVLAVAPSGTDALGAAVLDRLQRAAAPRPTDEEGGT